MNPGNFPHGTTADDFRKRPHSEPVNEVISNVFFKSGLMEAWGRGIPVLATYNIIKQTPGIQRKDIIVQTKKGSSTIDRHLAMLIEKNLIEHRGSKKTGGYYACV